MCCLSRPSMLFWLCCMTESPPWSTSWKLPLGHELGEQWALFSSYQGQRLALPVVLHLREAPAFHLLSVCL